MGQYEDALKRAKEFKKKYIGDVRNSIFAFLDKSGNIAKDFIAIFPELAETEDEKIIEEIKFAVMQIPSTREDTRQRCLAYLEKQKDEAQRQFNLGVQAGREEVLYEIERQKEQKPAGCGCSNDESEYDKGYRGGHRFGLKQTQEYMLHGGKTFSGLIPCWVNAPSELQSAHKYHGKNVVIMHENNGGFRCVCIDDEKPITFHLPEDTLFVEGWRKKPTEWSEEDEKNLEEAAYVVMVYRDMIANKDLPTAGDRFKVAKKYEQLSNWLKFLRPQPHWKPSEEQMYSLGTVVKGAGENSVGSIAYNLKKLYNDLKKL